MAAIQSFQSAFHRLLDAVLPLRCLGCTAMIDAKGSFCATCWRQLALIGETAVPPLRLPAAAGGR